MYQKDILDGGLIVSHYAGSHAYGTSTPESDVDIRGVFCAPLIYKVSPWLSCNEVSVPDEEDTKYYEFVKFLSLVVDQNPNIVETLWVDNNSVIKSSEAYEYLVSRRNDLLSSKVAFTYSGYAVSQLNRIKNHGKWINNPQPEKPPMQQDYIKMLQNFNEEKILKFDVLKYEKDHFFVHYGNDVYGIYAGKGERLFDNAGCIVNKFESNNHELGVPMFLVKYVKEEYKKDKEAHKNYWTWVKNRNEKRSELEFKYGYDCYHPDTEFLTNEGWLSYDDINSNHVLATVNPSTHCMEYQPYFDRVKNNYNGYMYKMDGQYTSMCVTANHRMYVSPCNRSKKTNFSTSYDESSANWEYHKMEDLHDGRKTYYHVLTGAQPVINDYVDVSDDQLKILGAFISEGSFTKVHNGVPRAISISQTTRGKEEFFSIMESVNHGFNTYVYYREDKDLHETTWNGYGSKNIYSKWLIDNCLSDNGTKSFPNWIYKLSARQSSILVYSLMLGDSTFKKHGDVYYTNDKNIAGVVQQLYLQMGKQCNVRGPYKYSEHDGMYQIYSPYDTDIYSTMVFNHRYKSLSKKSSRNVGGEKYPYNGNVVCFSVPNENLITRYNGKIAVQGNTKHAMHLVRLLRTAEEILTEGVVNVMRPDAQELLGIRNGSHTYDELVSWAEAKDKEIREVLYKNTDLRKKVNTKVANQIMVDVLDIMGMNSL